MGSYELNCDELLDLRHIQNKHQKTEFLKKTRTLDLKI